MCDAGDRRDCTSTAAPELSVKVWRPRQAIWFARQAQGVVDCGTLWVAELSGVVELSGTSRSQLLGSKGSFGGIGDGLVGISGRGGLLILLVKVGIAWQFFVLRFSVSSWTTSSCTADTGGLRARKPFFEPFWALDKP